MSDGPKTEMLNVNELLGTALDVVFVVTLPGSGEKRYPMRQATMRVGRSDQADIVVKDSSVSSRHCDLIKEGGAIFVRDLNSSNGTFLNDARVAEAELRNGDVLRLGNAAMIRIEVGNAPVAQAPGPIDNENAGSTMMISAGDLDAMRQSIAPPPAAPRPSSSPPRQAPQLTPAYAYQPEPAVAVAPSAGGKSRKGLVIGLAAGLVVLLIAGVAAVLVVSSGKKKKEDLERVTRMKSDVAALAQTSPCTAVQDSVSTVAKLAQSVEPPALPARAKARRDAERFVDAQRDMSKQYERIIANVEQLSVTSQLAVDRIKSDVPKLNDAELRATAAKVSKLLDDRTALSQEFIDGWRKLKSETESRAQLVDVIWVQGKGGQGLADEYAAFQISRPAPRILSACRTAHETNRQELDTALAEIERLAAAR